MENSEKKELPWRIPEWFPELKVETLSKLKQYYDELVRFNKRLSLVSSGTSDKIDLVHLADSILGWKTIGKVDGGLVDIGSGNGFPGVVIAILNPDLSMGLLESDTRKAEFLKHIVDHCGLKNTKVHTTRIEALPPKSISNGIIRGLAKIPQSLLLLRKVIAPGGHVYHFKGPEWSSELASMPQQLCSTWNNEHLGDYTLPTTHTIHTIIRSDLI